MTYEELLKLEVDNDEAVEMLFQLAKEDFIQLYKEMVEHEEIQHTFENYLKENFYKDKPLKSEILDQFLYRTHATEIMNMYHNSENVVGKNNMFRNYGNLFFIPLYDKFCFDKGIPWRNLNYYPTSLKDVTKHPSLRIALHLMEHYFWKLLRFFNK